MADAQHPVWHDLEPGAQAIVGPREIELGPPEGAIELSKAISLKRIADALDDVVRSGTQINVDCRSL